MSKVQPPTVGGSEEDCGTGNSGAVAPAGTWHEQRQRNNSRAFNYSRTFRFRLEMAKTRPHIHYCFTPHSIQHTHTAHPTVWKISVTKKAEMRYRGKQKIRLRPEGNAGWQIYNLISDCVELVGIRNADDTGKCDSWRKYAPVSHLIMAILYGWRFKIRKKILLAVLCGPKK